MFDRDYFEEILPGQVTSINTTPTVRIELGNGQYYYVRKIDQIRDGYVALDLHKWTNVGSFTTSPSDPVLPGAFAYESISNVIVGSTSADQAASIGFSLAD